MELARQVDIVQNKFGKTDHRSTKNRNIHSLDFDKYIQESHEIGKRLYKKFHESGESGEDDNESVLS